MRPGAFRCWLRGHPVDDVVVETGDGSVRGGCYCGSHHAVLPPDLRSVTVGKATLRHSEPQPSGLTHLIAACHAADAGQGAASRRSLAAGHWNATRDVQRTRLALAAAVLALAPPDPPPSVPQEPTPPG